MKQESEDEIASCQMNIDEATLKEFIRSARVFDHSLEKKFC